MVALQLRDSHAAIKSKVWGLESWLSQCLWSRQENLSSDPQDPQTNLGVPAILVLGVGTGARWTTHLANQRAPDSVRIQWSPKVR